MFRRLLIPSLGFVLILGFQNCGQSFDLPSSLDSNSNLGSATPTPTPVANPNREWLPGVNLSGGEYNLENINAVLYQNYVYPNETEINYFAAKGLKIVRVPFDLNRVQPNRNSALSSTEIGRLDTVIQLILGKNMKVLLDPHNYGFMLDNSQVSRRIGTPEMPNSNFADFWQRMAEHYKGQNNVYFGLMNEPYQHSATEWKAAAVAAVNAIRSTGATNKIFVQGTAWTGAHSWISSGNAAAWEGFSDSNFAFEVHQYLDSDSSGTHAECTAGTSNSVKAVTEWAEARNYDLFLGEIGWSTSSLCGSEARLLMDYLSAHKKTWIGFTYWAAGSWWGEYMFTLQPTGLGTNNVVDRPQLSLILSHL